MRDVVHEARRADPKVTNSTQLASAMIDGCSALLMFPAAFFLPLPHGAWGWLAAPALAAAGAVVLFNEPINAWIACGIALVCSGVVLIGLGRSVTRSALGWATATGGIGVAFALWRGPRFMLAARSQWRAGLFAGAMSIVTYGLALWAYWLGDTPRLAALRETSIVFATLIAVFVLKERVTGARAAGIGVIVLGAALLLMLN
jgi:uncharacterized membrane protein